MRLSPPLPFKHSSTLLRAGALVLLLWSAGACSLFQSNSGPPRQKGEPTFTGCLNYQSIEKFQNCGEYCASQNLGCQQFGCAHPSEKGRFGAIAFSGSSCGGEPTRSYQCTDPFVNDTNVKCC